MPTRSGLRAIVRRDQSVNSTDVITDSDLNDLLAEGAVQFARDGHAFVTKTSWNTAVSTSEYVLSGGASPRVTSYLDVYWEQGGLLYAPTSTTTKHPGTDFTIVSEAWLNREHPGWKEVDASDTLQHIYFGVNSSGYQVLGTVPVASTTTPQITLWAISSGTAMDGDTKYPYTNEATALANVEPFLKAIAYWALHVLHRDQTKMQGEGDKYLSLYNGLAEQCREVQRATLRAELQGLRQAGMVAASQSYGSL